jgi:hypothetical protein
MADAENTKEAVKEVLDGRREFTLETPDNEILHYYIASPSGEDIRKSDWQYSKVFNQAIVDGFLTTSQMLDVLKEKDIINDEYETHLESVRISLGAELFRLENLLENATEEEREVVALEIAKLRDELFQLNQRVNGPMANTCENLAEDARTDFLTSRIVEKKDNTKLWEDYTAYRHEDNPALAIKARFEVMLWMQGLESNFLESTPEQTALREIAQTRLNRALEEAEAEAKAETKAKRAAKAKAKAESKPDAEKPVAKSKPKRKPGRPKGRAKAKPKVDTPPKPETEEPK